MQPQEIIDFWFTQLTPKQWFIKDLHLDTIIKQRFTQIHKEILAGKKDFWKTSPRGMLALIIVLDQFSRNMFRDTTKAFAQNELALAIAKEAIAKQFDALLKPTQRKFLYMPFMHSENVKDHEQAVELFKSLNDEYTLGFEYQHKNIIDRFGRYPHRNTILARESTPQEKEFLKTNKGF